MQYLRNFSFFENFFNTNNLLFNPKLGIIKHKSNNLFPRNLPNKINKCLSISQFFNTGISLKKLAIFLTHINNF